MNSKPMVSVIIPVYNGEIFLREAVESIQRQAYQPLEIIIVNDGSTDGTASIAATFGAEVRYFYHANRGLPATRNRGLHEARGDFIAWLDVDDLWAENKLELQVAHLSADPTVDIVLGRIRKMKLMGYVEGKPKFQEWSDPEVALSPGSALFRKSVFGKVGNFDVSLQYCNDWDWFMRARELEVSMRIHPDVVYYYRRHENNMTEQIEEGNHDTLRMLKQSLTRRRQTNLDGARSLPKLVKFGEFPVPPRCQQR